MTNPACQQIRSEFQQNEAVCGHVLNLFQIISNKARFRIVCMLTQGEFCVQDIVETIDHGKVSNVSQQLRILTLANLVQRRRDNRQVLYSLKDKRLLGLIDYLRKQFLERTPRIMKNLLILGSGTAGTMMANHLHRKLAPSDWTITVVDQNPVHYYQPGFLFMPFGVYTEKDVVRPKQNFLPRGVQYRNAVIDRIDPEANRVLLQEGTALPYDLLIIATGTQPAPDEVEGMLGEDWQKRVFDFYTFEGSKALAEKLKDWKGGRLVVHISEMPIKCPVAPLEFAFLADWWLTERGLRDSTELVYVTPLSGAFTKPVAAKVLGHLLEEKRIEVVNDFSIAEVNNEEHKIVSWDEREVPYDLLVTVPPNMGDPMIERSGLGDELNYVATDRHTLQAKDHPNIFVLGDATDLPTSKAGSVAHFEAEVLTENILHYIADEPLAARFDGHANCFIESGHHKAFLLDFNYDLQPVPGHFPVPGVGPFSLLSESRINHWGKLAFKWVYWSLLLKAVPIPFVGHRMIRAGKQIPADTPSEKTAA